MDWSQTSTGRRSSELTTINSAEHEHQASSRVSAAAQPQNAGGFNPVQQFNPTPTSSHKDWHVHCPMDLRNHLIHKLVQTIFPYKDPSALKDTRMNNLICYSRKVEAEMYESANTKEEYYVYLPEKIYKIQTELQTKRNKRNNENRQSEDPNRMPNLQQQGQVGMIPTTNHGSQIRPSLPLDGLSALEIKAEYQDDGVNQSARPTPSQNDRGIKSEPSSNEVPAEDEVERLKTGRNASSGNSIDSVTQNLADLVIDADSSSQEPLASIPDSTVHECRFSNMDPAEKSLCRTEVEKSLMRDTMDFMKFKPSTQFLPHPISTGWYAECQNGPAYIALFLRKQRCCHVHNLANALLAMEDRSGPRGERMIHHMVCYARELEANYCKIASSEEEYMDFVMDEISRHRRPITNRLKLLSATLRQTAPPVGEAEQTEVSPAGVASPTSTSADASSSRVEETSGSILSDNTDDSMKHVKDGLEMLGSLLKDYLKSGRGSPKIDAEIAGLKRSREPTSSGSYAGKSLQTNGEAVSGVREQPNVSGIPGSPAGDGVPTQFYSFMDLLTVQYQDAVKMNNGDASQLANQVLMEALRQPTLSSAQVQQISNILGGDQQLIDGFTRHARPSQPKEDEQ